MTKYKGNRTEKIELRISPELKARIRKRADAEKITVTAWIERIALNALKRKPQKTGRTDDQ